ncbi:MAG: COX15/CtaA family protein [Alphaproteobacteria bacterium]
MPVNPDLMRSPASEQVWSHRTAVVLACATFPLLFIGGLVTSKGAGLAVPDWPTTFGYNMFLYPWSKMVGNIFYEHSHRLVASSVGLLTVALALTLWFREGRNWLRWLGIAALALVVVQGVVGGLRVILLEHTLAIIHAAFAQAFFAVTVSLVVFTSTGWSHNRQSGTLADGARLRRLCMSTTAVIYLQSVFGAILRHTGERLDAHLFFAAVVAVHVALIVIRVMRSHAQQLKLARPACLLGVLLLVQLFLGISSYLGKFTSAVSLTAGSVVLLTTSHLAIGALMLASSLVLTLNCYRLSSAAEITARPELLKEPLSV